MLCLQLYPALSRGHVLCHVVTPSSLQSQENVVLVVVYSALIALVWHNTVPDTVPETVPFVPFTRLLCDVVLTALLEPTRKCIEIPTSSPFASVYCYGPAHVKPKAPRDCLFPRSASGSVVLAPQRRPAACSCSNDCGLISRFRIPCSKVMLKSLNLSHIIPGYIQQPASSLLSYVFHCYAGIANAYCHCTPQ